MNNDIKQFKKFIFYHGKLLPAEWITSTDDYNHFTHHLHHYIKKQVWEKHKDWFIKNGIEQKLILLPAQCHSELHSASRKFKEKWGVDRELLIWRNK